MNMKPDLVSSCSNKSAVALKPAGNDIRPWSLEKNHYWSSTVSDAAAHTCMLSGSRSCNQISFRLQLYYVTSGMLGHRSMLVAVFK